jgi:nucleoside-diphosphate-sugar epimerase
MAEKVRDSLDTLSHICLVNPKDIYGPLYEEAWDKIPNSNKIKSLLGWEPKHDIDSIINDVITYWQRKV